MREGFLKRVAAAVFVSALVITCVPDIDNLFSIEALANRKSTKKDYDKNWYFETSGPMFQKNGGLLPGKYEVNYWTGGDNVGFIEVYDYSWRKELPVQYVKISSDNKNLKIKNHKQNYVWTFDAKKSGTYKIKIKAKEPGGLTATRTRKVYIAKPSQKKNSPAYLNAAIPVSRLLNEYHGKIECSVESGDDVVSIEDRHNEYGVDRYYDDGDNYQYITGKKEGTAKLRVTCVYNNESTVIPVNVVPNHITKLKYAKWKNNCGAICIYYPNDGMTYDTSVQISSQYEVCTDVSPNGITPEEYYSDEGGYDDITVKSYDPDYCISGNGINAVGYSGDNEEGYIGGDIVVSANGHTIKLGVLYYDDDDVDTGLFDDDDDDDFDD